MHICRYRATMYVGGSEHNLTCSRWEMSQADLYAGMASTEYIGWKEASVNIQATQLDTDRI